MIRDLLNKYASEPPREPLSLAVAWITRKTWKFLKEC